MLTLVCKKNSGATVSSILIFLYFDVRNVVLLKCLRAQETQKSFSVYSATSHKSFKQKKQTDTAFEQKKV